MTVEFSLNKPPFIKRDDIFLYSRIISVDKSFKNYAFDIYNENNKNRKITEAVGVIYQKDDDTDNTDNLVMFYAQNNFESLKNINITAENLLISMLNNNNMYFFRDTEDTKSDYLIMKELHRNTTNYYTISFSYKRRKYYDKVFPAYVIKNKNNNTIGYFMGVLPQNTSEMQKRNFHVLVTKKALIRCYKNNSNKLSSQDIAGIFMIDGNVQPKIFLRDYQQEENVFFSYKQVFEIDAINKISIENEDKMILDMAVKEITIAVEKLFKQDVNTDNENNINKSVANIQSLTKVSMYQDYKKYKDYRKYKEQGIKKNKNKKE